MTRLLHVLLGHRWEPAWHACYCGGRLHSGSCPTLRYCQRPNCIAAQEKRHGRLVTV